MRLEVNLLDLAKITVMWPGAIQRSTTSRNLNGAIFVPIDIDKVPSRARRVIVNIQPAQWQEYIAS